MEVDGSDCPRRRNLIGSPCLRLLDRRLDATFRSRRSSRKAWRSMDASQSPIWFIGDLGDPWIAEIAGSIASVRSIRRLDCPGSLPTYPFDRMRPPRLIVLHRHHLGLEDAVRLVDWRLPQGASPPPALFLCISPYVRYVELERVSRMVELVVSEGTAAEVLPRHVVRLLDGSERRSPPAAAMGVRIEVACGNDELSRALVEACGVAGYRAEPVDDQEIGGILRGRHRPTSTPERVLTIWEVPVLEPDWAERLASRALRTGPIIALAGFADRAIVTRRGPPGPGRVSNCRAIWRMCFTPSSAWSNPPTRKRGRYPLGSNRLTHYRPDLIIKPGVGATRSWPRHGQIGDRCLEFLLNGRRPHHQQPRDEDASQFDEIRPEFAGRWAQRSHEVDPARAGVSGTPRVVEE